MKVNLQAMSENRGGLVVNLMANDVNRFDTGPLFVHYLWIGPIETLVRVLVENYMKFEFYFIKFSNVWHLQLMTVYLYREMGTPAVYGTLIIIAVVPFQSKKIMSIITPRSR